MTHISDFAPFISKWEVFLKNAKRKKSYPKARYALLSNSFENCGKDPQKDIQFL